MYVCMCECDCVCALFLLAEMEVLFALLRSTYSRQREREGRAQASKFVGGLQQLQARSLLVARLHRLIWICLPRAWLSFPPSDLPGCLCLREREREESVPLAVSWFLELVRFEDFNMNAQYI